MPRASRKKRCLLNPHKSHLLFVEAPVNGPKHECGPQLRSAIHPKTFISEKQGPRHAPCASWVSPQFSLQNIKGGGGRGKNKSTTRSKSHTASLLPQDRRKPACKYTPLCFETNTAVSQHRHTNICTKTAKEVKCLQGKSDRPVSTINPTQKIKETPKRTTSLRKGEKRCTAKSTASRPTEISNDSCCHRNEKKTSEGFDHTSVSKGSQTPDTSSVSAPPNVETPELPNCASSRDVLHLLFPPNLKKSPPQTQNTSVLVKDTPEGDYGLRVTWRRRKALMKLLIDRDRLDPTDARVVNE